MARQRLILPETPVRNRFPARDGQRMPSQGRSTTGSFAAGIIRHGGHAWTRARQLCVRAGLGSGRGHGRNPSPRSAAQASRPAPARCHVRAHGIGVACRPGEPAAPVAEGVRAGILHRPRTRDGAGGIHSGAPSHARSTPALPEVAATPLTGVSGKNMNCGPLSARNFTPWPPANTTSGTKRCANSPAKMPRRSCGSGN